MNKTNKKNKQNKLEQKVDHGHLMFDLMSNASDLNSKCLAKAIIKGLDPDAKTLSTFLSDLLEQYEDLRKNRKNTTGDRENRKE